MPYYLKLALKNVFRQKKRSFTLGVNYFVVALLLLLVFSFSEGVKKNFSGNLVSVAAGQITLSGETVVKGKTLLGIADYPKVAQVFQDKFGPGTKVLARYKLTSTVYNRGLSKSLSFQGIDTAVDTALKDQLHFQTGTWDGFVGSPNGVLISRTTADYLELAQDDELIISTRTRYGAFNTATVKVAGIYDSANYFVQDIVVSHFDFLQTLDLSDKGSATNLFVYFDKPGDLGLMRDQALPILKAAGYKPSRPASGAAAISVVAAASTQYKMLGADVNERRLTVATVDEVVSLLSQAQTVVNGAGLFLASILLFIIAISIFINMRMTINDRIQEIGTLRAIGTEVGDIVAMLVAENVFLSLVFVAAGLVTGLALVFVVSHGLTLPPAGMLSLFLDGGHLVLVPTMASLLTILVATSVFTGLFSYFPARRGGQVNPAVALGTTY
jgi:putative ABC transport system permease protein